MVLDDGSKEEQPQYCLEKYFSNGDINRANRPNRRQAATDRRRYSNNDSDEENER